MTRTIVKLALGAVLFSGALVAQQEPALNISGKNHPDLATAQNLVREAFNKISVAQRANHEDMEGHAEKAKNLLVQVNQELQLAAEAANKNHKK